MTDHVGLPPLHQARLMAWNALLVGALLVNAALLLGYRIHRLTRGGPMGDVVGGAILAGVLTILAVVAGAGGGWARWPALAYALLFALIVMPVWTLAILIPLPPGGIDYAFTALYWTSLLVIALAAVMA